MPFRNSIDFVLSFCTFQISSSPWKMKGSQNLAGMTSFSPQTLQEHNEVISCNYYCSKSPIFYAIVLFLLLESNKLVFVP